MDATIIYITDKIRPEWDWKIDIILSDPEKYLKIKSDQNGIESN